MGKKEIKKTNSGDSVKRPHEGYTFTVKVESLEGGEIPTDKLESFLRQIFVLALANNFDIAGGYEESRRDQVLEEGMDYYLSLTDEEKII